MATHKTLSALFTDIAAALRERTGATGTIVADMFPEKIRSISSSEHYKVTVGPGSYNGMVQWVDPGGSVRSDVPSDGMDISRMGFVLLNLYSVNTPSVSGGVHLLTTIVERSGVYSHIFWVDGAGSISP